MTGSPPRRFERYVALGDSSTEGLEDPDGSGGYRGWSRRLAQRIANVQGSLEYANLGVRGSTTPQMLREQLAHALALRPDLATVFSGTNDLASVQFDAVALARDMEAMQHALIAGGATVLTFTLPDSSPVMPLARLFTSRIRALNAELRAAAARTGATLLDFAVLPIGSDPRVWSDDRVHANSLGHSRIADALSEALGLPDTDDAWSRPLPLATPKSHWEWISDEMVWTQRHLLPWIGRGLRRRAADSLRVGAHANPGLVMLTRG